MDVANGDADGMSPYDGQQFITFDQGNTLVGGTLSQTFSTTIGTLYEVGFVLDQTGSGTMSLAATVSAQNGSIISSNHCVSTENEWTYFQFTFTATSTNSTLMFTDTSLETIAVDIALDDVTVAVAGTGGSVQFTASPTTGAAPLAVNFTSPSVDSMSNSITGRDWSFGDGTTSTAQNPSHTYTVAGTYSPTLYATNNYGVVISASGPSITVSAQTSGTNSTNTFTVLHTFNGNDGSEPLGTLTISNNTLYGTTWGYDYYYSGEGYYYNDGTVFSVNTSGGNFTNVYNFNQSGINNYGNSPYGGVVLAGNTLYGTTWEGGVDGYGTVFSVNTDGTGFSTLHTFSYNNDGAYPYAGLIISGNTLYGTTWDGGVNYGGTVYSLNTNGTGFKTLHSFTGGNDGDYPFGGLVLSGSTLYGTTEYGGPLEMDYGIVFAISTNGGTITNLHSFAGVSDGEYPECTLAISGNTLYGTARDGGSSGYGTAFSVSASGGSFTNLHSFKYATDGGYPVAGLALSGNTLYGTAEEGGSNGYGTVFALNTDGTGFTNLHSFNYSRDGGYPEGGVIIFGNTLYGTTEDGGTNGEGTVYSLAVSNSVVIVSGTVQFTASPTIGMGPLMVDFSSPSVDSQTNPIIGWDWAFGDGTTTNVQNPTHTYTIPGTYSPTLLVTNTNGAVIAATGPSISVSPPPSSMAYTATPITGVAPLTVNFSTPSTDTEGYAVTNWIWTFGDGSTSTNQSPSHAYTSTGPFSPSLVATNINGSPVTATGPSLISVYEAAIAFRTSSTNGTVPLQVQFTSANVDLAGNPIVKWNWDFGDGSTSTAQTPIHIYTSANSFSPTLAATNSIGSTITGFGPGSIIATNVPVYSGLVLNGGFETGDLTGWTYSGAASNSFNVFVDNGSQSEIAPNSGTYLAAFCPLGSPGYISQTLATTAGTPYLLSLWLDSPDGGSPNQFMVSWNGTTLFNQANIANIGWTNLQFWVTATGTATALEIGGRDDPSYLGIDNVSVVPVQPSISSLQLSGTQLVLTGSNGLTAGTYYVLTSTNLTAPLAQWTLVTKSVLSTNGPFSVSFNPPVTSGSAQQYYILRFQEAAIP